MINIIELCKHQNSVCITGHVRPDGDCVGSCLGLYLFLKKALPECKVNVVLEESSGSFAGLKGYEEILRADQCTEPFDVVFVLDSTLERCGEAYSFVETAKMVINVDHHISNTGSGNACYIVTDASSTSELIYDLIQAADPQLQYMCEDIAQAIYMGVAHDTGIFQYSNTSPKTLRMIADLLEYKFDFSKLVDETFYEKTYLQSQITGRAILESIRFMDGKCIVSAIDLKMMQFYNVTSKDFEGIVNQLRIVKGVECAIFMYETERFEYKVSLRSKGKLDVSKVATYFGGGGHVRAAGCNMKGTFHDVVNNLSKQIALQMED